MEHDHSPAQGDALHPLADISERLEAARTLIETRFSDAGGRLAGSLDMVSSLIESLDDLFTAFSRQDHSLTRRFGGLGLGLASARAFAGRMGGEVDGRPRPEGGSVFWLQLPAPMLTAAALDITVDHQTPVAGRLRILVADDHPTNRRVLELILADIADVTAVVDGQEALDTARLTRFDVILMDIQMPVMDGITPSPASGTTSGPTICQPRPSSC